MEIGVTWPSQGLSPDILGIADCVEIADLSDLGKLSPRKEWTYHFRFRDPFDRKSGGLNLLDLAELQRSWIMSRDSLRRRPPKLASLHLGYSAGKKTKVAPDGHNVAASPVLFREEMLERFRNSLNWILEVSPFPVAIENMDYHVGGAYEHCCRIDFINEILRQFPGLYLLLDLAHFQISAVKLIVRDMQNFGFDPFPSLPKDMWSFTGHFLGLLPLARVIEMQVNSPELQGNDFLDMHQPITSTEERLIATLLPKMPNLQVINLECETEIKQQLKRLKALTRVNAG